MATVKPQLQEAQPPSSTKTTSYPKRKGKGKQNTSAPKRPKSKRNRKDDEPTIVKEYPLRGRNSGDKEWNNELRSDSETYLPGRQQDTAHQAKHGNNESKMTHLARYSEIYTFQSTPRQSLSKINSDSYYGEEKQPRCYGGRPSVIERRSDVLAFENDSPLGTDETSQIRFVMICNYHIRWAGLRGWGLPMHCIKLRAINMTLDFTINMTQMVYEGHKPTKNINQIYCFTFFDDQVSCVLFRCVTCEMFN